MRFAMPLAVFLILIGVLGAGLRFDPREVPSPLIDRPAPSFRLPQLHRPDRTFSPEEMKGQVWLLNVWASWCVSCRAEHPLFLALARSGLVPVHGLDYKDGREEALEFLAKLGDPYALSVHDPGGRVGIDYGVYGVPETYLIDKEGVIRFKRAGPVTLEILEKTILPMVERLKQ